MMELPHLLVFVVIGGGGPFGVGRIRNWLDLELDPPWRVLPLWVIYLREDTGGIDVSVCCGRPGHEDMDPEIDRYGIPSPQTCKIAS